VLLRTPLLSLLLLALACACATTDRRRGAPLTSGAQDMLGRALGDEHASGLVVDLTALERVGFAGGDGQLGDAVELLSFVLPLLATTLDEGDRELVARLGVAIAVLRDWAKWPGVRGLALRVEGIGEQGVDPTERMVLALAVDQDTRGNQELVNGLFVLARAVAAGKGSEDFRLQLRGQDACVVPTDAPISWCVRSGPGFLLMGNPEAMTRYAQLALPAKAAASQPVLVKFRASFPEQATVSLLMTGKDAVQVQAQVESPSPVMLAKAEQAVEDFLRKYDTAHSQQQALTQAALLQLQQGITQDAEAPASMKKAVQALSVQTVTDPQGHWAQARSSLQSGRVGGRYDLSFILPKGGVEDLARLTTASGGTGAYSIGVMAAVAVPNFIKFQCRSKQAEALASLRAAAAGQQAFAVQHRRWARTFEEVGFRPEPGNRYAYCMGEQCLPCTAADCKMPLENPCAGMSGVGRTLEDGFQICAFANLDDDPNMDIWLVDDRGEPEAGENDCD
jgi:type II secretory pathway pseudopilin PulG